MKRTMIILTAAVLALQLCNSLYAVTTTAQEAQMAVKGWLKLDPKPLGANLGREVSQVETFNDESGEPVYYIVYLEPSSFVIVSADDLVEPIIGFTEEGTYSPSTNNPLAVLVTKNINRQIAVARSTIGILAVNSQPTVTKTQMKWNYLLSLAEASDAELALMAVTPETVTDICVAPLISAIWGQEDACGYNCFNMYTPNNYPCGCVATMMAQVMRLHQYPTEPNDNDPSEPDGKRKFLVEWFDTDSLSFIIAPKTLRGGDGNGGPYQWNKMPDGPDCNTSSIERQAIGAICYDAGIASNMFYTEWGSGTYITDASQALIDVFNYSSAIQGCYDPNAVNNIPAEILKKMVNPGLDAGCPVFFGIYDEQQLLEGHAVLCDGYGCNASTIYHHLNFGWTDMPTWARQMWFLLPDISYGASYDYDIIGVCVYNIFTTEKGEIISGRIFDGMGNPVQGVSLTAQIKGGKPNTAKTTVSTSTGIYAFRGLNSDTTYTITAEKEGYEFEPAEATTGKSESKTANCGNVWAFNFSGESDSVTIGAGKISWVFPMYTGYADARTQVIYLADEIGKTGNISSLSLDVTQVPGQTLENWTIRMKHTGLDKYTSSDCSFEADGWTVVYQNNESVDSTGWHKFEFQTPFVYNGTDNLMIDFSFNNETGTSHGLCKVSSPGGQRSAYDFANNDRGDPLDWQDDALSHTNMPDIILTFSE
ncbi:MAG: C10 family peptidase [Sedimentisphaerales bacterium]|nr:C10 family peptidase [Sedimentisphaerales bacterium]